MYASKIAPLKVPQSLLVMPGKPVVLLTDLTSDPVYPAALFPHAFTIRRGVIYAYQNRMPLCTNLAHAARNDFLYTHVSHKSAYPPSPRTTHPRRIPILAAYLCSAPTYPQHLPIFTIYLSVLHTEGRRVCKVSAKGYPVLLGMANTSPNSEYMMKQGCRIYRITGKITEKHCRLTRHN